MINISNSLSFLRAPLALLFLQSHPVLRLLAILLATLTDSIDGYLARKYRRTTQFGAILDPLMDKFFVYFALIILFQEGALSPLEISAMLSRDVALCLYGLFMAITGRWKSIIFRSARWGKATTALQFVILSGLVFNLPFPAFATVAFIIMGALALIELFQQKQVLIKLR
ncbi:MAG TPA: CDP-alcohol phosphatidyltransferase family protein [Chlamydiales bacterium]|nr:CDP-alcohol phosphatidyltransferase family protein [Chlamydiales bacterium]